MGGSRKLRFYELDHESKMRLLKTHSHTSNGLAMEPGTREKSRPYNKVKATRQKPAACRRCGGGGRKGARTCRIPPVWWGGGRKGSTANRSQKRRYALVDMEGNTGANTREKSCEKPSAGHRHGGGLDEETTNTRDGRWQHLQPREGGKCLVEKSK